MADNLPDKAGKPIVAFRYGEVDVLQNEDRHVNLTQMFEAAGKPAGKEPAVWQRRDDAKGFIADLGQSLNVRQSHVLKSMRGKGGATWAHWQIGLAYAKYLSHEFHRFVNEAFREWAEEQADPDLKAKRTVALYRRKGMDDDTIAARLAGIAERKDFTGKLKDHNCKILGKDNPYAEATRVLTMAAVGKTPKELKAAKGLPAKAKTRDHMDKGDLILLKLGEALASQKMEAAGSDGNAECLDVVRLAAKAVKAARGIMGA